MKKRNQLNIQRRAGREETHGKGGKEVSMKEQGGYRRIR